MKRLIALTATLAAVASNALAQDACQSGRRVPDFGYGMTSCHDCSSVVMRDGVAVTRFSAQPALYQIRAGGPGAGRLMEGDTLVSVDGLAITTEAAAVRLATFRAGEVHLTVRRSGASREVAITPLPVCLSNDTSPDQWTRVSTLSDGTKGVAYPPTVTQLVIVPLPAPSKSGGDSLAERRFRAGVITEREYSRILGQYAGADSLARATAELRYRAGVITQEEYERALGHYVTADSIARVLAKRKLDIGAITPREYETIISRPRPDTVPPVRQLITANELSMSPGVIGLGIQCRTCSLQQLADGKVRWEFSDYPVVAAVAPGSIADMMGIRAGDVLRAIDGMSITTRQGGERLGAYTAGKSIRFTWTRGTEQHNAGISTTITSDR